jgi:hypothetical protein
MTATLCDEIGADVFELSMVKRGTEVEATWGAAGGSVGETGAEYGPATPRDR